MCSSDLGRRIGIRVEGPIERVEEGSHVGGGQLVRIRYQLGLDIDDENGADSGEETSLGCEG